MNTKSEDWNLQNLPPAGHPDVAAFAYKLFDIARAERDRLGKPADWMANYSLYRGNQQKTSARKGSTQQTRSFIPINLYFANVERTVSNITARNPTGEVVDIDGYNDGAEQIISQRLHKWWKDTDQQAKTRQSARMMEIYGIAVEKPYWDKQHDQPDMMSTDPFAFYPAPGYWDSIAEEAPYICYVYLDYVSKIEKMFNVKGIAKEEAYDLLGTSREGFKPQGYALNRPIGDYAESISTVSGTKGTEEKPVERTIVIEVWVRDEREETIIEDVPQIDEEGNIVLDEAGQPVMLRKEITKRVYPDGIRKITIAKSKNREHSASGYIVLEDCPNPNINPSLPVEVAANTYPWGRLPCYHVNSYRDEVSIWGFSAAEQVGDLLAKISLIMTKLVSYVINIMSPPLIVQKNCGITREMIESTITKTGRMILMPTTPTARIEFMQVPNLPETFFRVLDLIVKFFDRIYQIEDADRGVAPTGVIAASAIVALQERNAVVMQTKTSSIDALVEQRSRWAIGLWQNFGIEQEVVNVAGEQKMFMGTAYANRKFSYVVESGSMTPRTSLQLQETALNLYKLHAIGQQGLLEAMKWPNWKDEVARTASDMLGQALQTLVDAGLPEEMAVQLRQILENTKIQQDMRENTGKISNKTGLPRAI